MIFIIIITYLLTYLLCYQNTCLFFFNVKCRNTFMVMLYWTKLTENDFCNVITSNLCCLFVLYMFMCDGINRVGHFFFPAYFDLSCICIRGLASSISIWVCLCMCVQIIAAQEEMLRKERELDEARRKLAQIRQQQYKFLPSELREDGHEQWRASHTHSDTPLRAARPERYFYPSV